MWLTKLYIILLIRVTCKNNEFLNEITKSVINNFYLIIKQESMRMSK